MAELKISSSLVGIISSYLSGRTFRVRVHTSLSSSHPIPSGVPQGSLLGPDLFLIYASDIPRTQGTDIAMYADDTAIYASCRDEDMLIRRIQEATDDFLDWTERWRFSVNAGKCVAMRFTFKRVLPSDNILINDTRLPWSRSVRYLGLTFDPRLSWASHIAEARKKYNKARHSIMPLICRNSPLALETKLLLYKSMLRPIFTYGALSWLPAASCHINTLEVLQSKFLRLITRAPFFVRNEQIRKDLRMPSVKDYLLELSSGTFDRASVSDNPVVAQTIDPGPDRRTPKRRILRPAALILPSTV